MMAANGHETSADDVHERIEDAEEASLISTHSMTPSPDTVTSAYPAQRRILDGI